MTSTLRYASECHEHGVSLYRTQDSTSGERARRGCRRELIVNGACTQRSPSQFRTEINCKKPNSWYKLYSDGGFLSLIWRCSGKSIAAPSLSTAHRTVKA
eukprot:2724881-Rhodomonas_salina.1